MATALPPVRGSAFSFEMGLVSQADTDIFQVNPTLAAGDVKVIKDGVYDDNIDSLPSAVASVTQMITVTLSATEMTADRVTVVFKDAAGNQWQDAAVTIYTTAQTLDTIDSNVDTVLTNLATIEADIGAIGVASGTGLNYEAEDDNTDGAIKTVSFTGVQTSGTYASTEAEDGTYHQIDDTANAIDIIYQFDVTGIRKAVQCVWKGYLSGSNDTITVKAYDYVGLDWETRGTINGVAGTTNQTGTFTLLSKHTGTGTDIGKVLIRFVCSGQSNPALYTDSLLVEAAIANQSVGYADGAIWIDTSASNTNTENFVDGVADNPVSTWAAALTLSGTLGINKFRIAGGSSITLTGDSSDYEFYGAGLWTLALGGQTISNAYIRNASVSGTGAGSGTIFEDCRLTNSVSIPPSYLVRCGIAAASGTPLTAAAAGEYVLIDCFSLVAGSGVPFMNFSGTGSASGVNIRRWAGGSNITLDSNNSLSLEVVTGGGQTITTGGANVEVRGTCRALTVAVSGSETVQFAGVTGPIALSGAATATINLYGVSSSLTDTTSGCTVNDATITADVAAVKADTAAILLDTGTDGVVLANDSITSGKYDESTAFPLKAADAGTTYIARTGADSDTLETLSDQLDSGATAASIWTYATRTLTATAASTMAAVSGSTLAITSRATYTATLSGLTISASWGKIWFTVKGDLSDADASSLIQIVESNPGVGTDGLLYLNGAAATAGQGSLTVDQAAGTIAIVITDEATDDLAPAEGLAYDVKQLVSGVTTVLTSGIANITYTATAAIA